MDKRQQKHVGCGVGCLHLVATIFVAFYALSLDLASHHRARRPLPAFFEIQQTFAMVLYEASEFPLMTAARFIAPEKSIAATPIIWILNSLIFGFGFAFIVKQLRKPR